MKRLLFLLCVFIGSFVSCLAYEYDLVIVGGTPGGITAAIAAARQDKQVMILERTAHVGGLPANGLGATDITTRGATTGLFIDFVERNRKYYLEKYGAGSRQFRDCSDGYHFEPSVAEQTFLSMIAGYSGKIKVMYNRQFDSDPANVTMKGNEVQSILVTDRTTGQVEKYTAKIFIDATYEGDLAAAANIPYRLGRESRAEYGEPCAGKIYRHWGVQFNKGVKAVHNGYEGYESDGTTYQGDNAVQAYNYRMCLTSDKSNMVPVRKPDNYNREEFESIIEDVLTGRNTGVDMLEVSAEEMEANRRHILAGGKTMIPGDSWGISKVTNMVTLPNNKTDANNQHMAFLSTDLPEENWPWPTASWEWRDRFAQRLKDYTLGLLWFVQNDKSLPEHFRKECRKWGLASDEYKDNGNFPRQVYVREGRRMEGTYTFTANDAISSAIDRRPPIHSTSITASHYALDSHAVLKREKDRAHLDGFFGYESKPYTVPLGVMVPKHVTNLLFPVPVSGSHIGFSTMRMEPCWMALGEAAGVAAAQAIDSSLPVQCLNVSDIQKELVRNKVTLIYFSDIDTSSECFEMVQLMGVRGYLPDWQADLAEGLDKETGDCWKKLSGIEVPADITVRGDALKFIYSRIK